MHIGIVRLSAIGDAVLVLPAIRALQDHWPQAKITWVTTPLVHSLLGDLSGVDFVLIDKPANPLDYLRLGHAMSALRFDILLCMQASMRVNLIYPLLRAKRKIGFDPVRARDLQALFTTEQIKPADHHLADGFLSFVRHIGARPDQIRWDLPIKADALVKAGKVVDPDRQSVAINPAASKPERTWPTDRFIALINRIPQDIQVLLTGGPSAFDIELADEIAKSVNRPVHNLVGKTDLSELAACLSLVDVLVAPDTGPVHIANALGVPVVGQYAVARPELSGPYKNLSRTVNRYPQAVQEFLGIPASKAGWHQRVHHADAMALISVDAVLTNLSDALDDDE